MLFRCLFISRNKRAIKTLIISQHNLISYNKNNSNVFKKQNFTSNIKSSNLRSPILNPIMDIDTKLIKSTKAKLLRVFDSAVSSVLPSALIEEKVKLAGNHLLINGVSHTITENVYLVGFGKAVAGMAYTLEKLLGSKLKRGIISVPRASLTSKISDEFEGLHERVETQIQNLMMLRRSKIIEYHEGAENNQPDNASLAATERIIDLAQRLEENDTLVVLISGGGSALLFQPKAPLTLEEKRDLCRRLQNSGASITELNCVRRQLSKVKGGGLAKIAYPAKILALVLSDIVGDPLESIASGPTCPVKKNDQEEAINILKKYKLYDGLEENIKQLLLDNSINISENKGIIEEGKFKHVENIIIGNNINALNTAKETAEKFDMKSVVLTSTIVGDVKDVSYAYAKFTKSICYALENEFASKEDFINEILKQKLEILNITPAKLEEIFIILKELRKDGDLLLLAGGEPTVTVTGSGKGGRNQELALRFSLDWLSEIAKNSQLAKYFVFFLSVGTDGQDGPTDAAGAFGNPAFRPKMTKILQDILKLKQKTCIPEQLHDLNYKLEQVEEMIPENVLQRNDSYSFYSKFENGKNLIKTGLTGTNVMDLHFIYIKKRECECNNQEICKDSDSLEDCDFLFNVPVIKADLKINQKDK